jgi:hypothetical protein
LHTFLQKWPLVADFLFSPLAGRIAASVRVCILKFATTNYTLYGGGGDFGDFLTPPLFMDSKLIDRPICIHPNLTHARITIFFYAALSDCFELMVR